MTVSNQGKLHKLLRNKKNILTPRKEKKGGGQVNVHVVPL